MERILFILTNAENVTVQRQLMRYARVNRHHGTIEFSRNSHGNSQSLTRSLINTNGCRHSLFHENFPTNEDGEMLLVTLTDEIP